MGVDLLATHPWLPQVEHFETSLLLELPNLRFRILTQGAMAPASYESTSFKMLLIPDIAVNCHHTGTVRYAETELRLLQSTTACTTLTWDVAMHLR